MQELEPLIDELGDMYDELVARVLSFNTINEKYAKLSFMDLTKEMVKDIFARMEFILTRLDNPKSQALLLEVLNFFS